MDRILQATNYPRFGKHSSCMARSLTPELYERYQGIESPSGFTFDRVIQVGVDNPGDLAGCVAGDEECFTLFRDLFDPVIDGRHAGYGKTVKFRSDLDASKIVGGDNLDAQYVMSSRVRTGRSISGYSLPPQIGRGERRELEQVLVNALSSLDGPFEGQYHAVRNMTKEFEDQLRRDKYLYNVPDTTHMHSTKIARDWPDGRGIWYNNDKNFIVWVNEEDHVRVMAMEKGGCMKRVFERFCKGLSMVEDAMRKDGRQYMRNDHLGFINTCPSNLGTGLRASVHVKLPNFFKHDKSTEILKRLRLDKRGRNTQTASGEFDISNLDRIGRTEVELVQLVVNGVNTLLAMEKALENGEDIMNLWPEEVSKPVSDSDSSKDDLNDPQVETAITTPTPGVIKRNNFPDLSKITNALAKCLTEDIYNKLKDLKTESGVTFDQCIQVGVDGHGDLSHRLVGVRAGDEESYQRFADLFDPVIKYCHNGYSKDGKHHTDLESSKVKGGNDLDSEFVLSTRLSACRSIRSFPLLLHCNRLERRAVERVCKQAMEGLDGCLKGEYVSLFTIDNKKQEELQKGSFLFGRPAIITYGDIARDWPDARGVFLNKDENFMIWVNEKDHARFICMENGGNIKVAFERLCSGLQSMEAQIKKQGQEFMCNEHLGYLLTCPGDIGTGLRACVRVRLPRLSNDERVDLVLDSLGLQKHGAYELDADTNDGVFAIQNSETLGLSEVELIQKVIDGIKILIDMEKKLMKGESIDDLIPK